MTEHEELLMLRALVEKQKKEIEKKDETIRRQNIQIESMLQALLHARKQRFGRSSEATEFQYFKYHYDRKGRHTGFSTLSGFACDYLFIEDSILPFNDYSEEITVCITTLSNGGIVIRS